MRPSIRHLLLAALFTASTPAAAKIAPDDKPLCLPGVCFVSEEARQEYEREKNCIVTNDKCAYSVDRVKRVAKSIPSTDPTYGFYRNQLCIADKSCGSKAQLHNAEWLDNVVYDFIDPLVEERGEWKAKKAECKNYVILDGLRCQQLMAAYHIKIDLQNSVNKNGCGDQKDWDQIGVWLESCIAAGIKEDVLPKLQNTALIFAKGRIHEDRTAVRQACLKYRKDAQLNVEY